MRTPKSAPVEQPKSQRRHQRLAHAVRPLIDLLESRVMLATYAISPNSGSVGEAGGSLTFTITRSGTPLPAETIYASTAQTEGYTNSGDYTGFANQAVAFTLNQTQKTVTVPITNDTAVENNETFGLVVQRNTSDPLSTYLAKATFTIVDNDTFPTTYSISPNPGSVNEGAGSLNFTVTRSGGLPAETVYASTTQDQGYTNSGDYVGLPNQGLPFALNQTQAMVTVSITNDTTVENNETFGLVVQRNSTDPLSTYLAKTTFTITDNDTLPTTYSLSPNPATVSEGAGSVSFTITRSGGLPAETVYASTAQTEGYINSGDYSGLSSQGVVFSANQTQATVTVSVTNDTAVENNETFGLIVQRNASDPVTTYLAKSTFTITDNDTLPTTYSITPNPASVNEGAGSLSFTITRSGGLPSETIYASTLNGAANGYATNSGDYGTNINNLAVVFSLNQTQATVTVSVTNDSTAETNETFGLIVQRNTSDPVTTYLAKSNFTIIDNDTAAVPSISGVLPTSMPASNSDQTLTINGSNFVSGATLTFDPPTGGNINSNAAKLTFNSSGQITYQINNGSDAGTWAVRVNNPDGQQSGWVNFNVTAPGDDAYEDNDSKAIADARPEAGANSPNLGLLASARTVSGLKMSDSADWFKFRMDGAGTSADFVRIDFTHAQGDLDLVVYRADGTSIVATSAGVGNSETISLTGQSAGTYYAKVYGYKGVLNPSYALTIDPATTLIIDDAYENNDSKAIADARPEAGANSPNLGLLASARTVSGLKMSDSADWFKFRMDGAGTSADFVRIDFTHAQGDLDLVVYRADGTSIVATSAGVGNSETISLTGQSAGTYYAKVYGYRGVANPNYSLSIDPAVVVAPSVYTIIDAGFVGTRTDADGDGFAAALTLEWSANVNVGSDQVYAHIYADSWDAWERDLGTTDTYTIGTASTPHSFTIPIDGKNLDHNTWDFQIDLYRAGTNERVAQLGMGADSDLNDVKVELTTQDSFQVQLTFANMTTAQQQVFEQAADRWEQVITGDIPDSWYNRYGLIPTSVDDVRIDVSFEEIDGKGDSKGNTLGHTSITDRRLSNLPVRAEIVLDTDDVATMESQGIMYNVALHELGHALGVDQRTWSLLGLVTGTGGDDPRFTGSQATAAYNAIFGTTDSSVPVENTGEPGTRNTHWRDSVFVNELMTGWSQSGHMPLSRITVGALADIGYRVNMNAADPYTPPASIDSPLPPFAATGVSQFGPVMQRSELLGARNPLPGILVDESSRSRLSALFSDVRVVLS